MFILSFPLLYVDKGVPLAYGGALGEKRESASIPGLGADFHNPTHTLFL